MFKRIKSVIPLDDYKLSVTFMIGVTKIYDVSKLFNKYKMFDVLKDKILFYTVIVDIGGYAVIWNDDLDISCNELWKNGELVKTPFDGLIAFSDATSMWGLNESTLRKAVSYGKLINGVDVCKLGHQWVVTTDAMKREYGFPKIED